LQTRTGQVRSDGSTQSTTIDYLEGTSFPTETIALENDQVTTASKMEYNHLDRPIDIYKASLVDLTSLPGLQFQYEKFVEVDYDNLGQVIKVVGRDGINEHYHYGYGNTLPVASIIQPNTASTFYEGFEEGGAGTVTQWSKTGRYSHFGTYSVDFPAENNYVITWYQLENGVKTRHELPFTGNITIGTNLSYPRYRHA